MANYHKGGAPCCTCQDSESKKEKSQTGRTEAEGARGTSLEMELGQLRATMTAVVRSV